MIRLEMKNKKWGDSAWKTKKPFNSFKKEKEISKED